MHPDFLERLDPTRALALLGEAAAARDRARVGRFRIERRLGEGSSGVVYLATDSALDRRVALKLLAPHLARDAAALERFAVEARAAAALAHPRVVPVLEVGRDGDDAYIAMAYLEGVTLRERLRAGPLPVADAVRIALEVAEALGAAHAAGIIHRDIKPENVLLTAQGACLLDFGIAKIAGHTLTMTGVTLGTPAYMSPEQTHGGAVDARTDLWALGVMLHEMLGGERPFRGEGTDALIYGVRHDAAPALPRTVPAHVRRVVARCLAKAPAGRPPSAGAVIEALTAPDAPHAGRRRLVVALAVAACLVAAWIAARPTRRADVRPVAGTRVALVPFDVDSGATPPEYLASELFVDTRAALGHALPRRLVHSGAVRIAQRQGDDAPALARRFEAGTLVTGTFRTRSDSIVLALAVLGPDGAPRWRGEVARPLAAAAGLADAARDRVLAALGEPLPPPAGPVDPVAYDRVLRARFAMTDENDFARRQAVTLAEEAIAHDSAYAPAFLQLALVLQARQDQRDAPRIRALAERALALDSTLTGAYRVLGQLVAWDDHDWARAEAMLRRAVALDPSDPYGAVTLMAVQLGAGRADDALATMLHARETDPLSPTTFTHLAVALLASRRPDVAIGAIRQSMAVDPNWTFKANVLGRALLATGRTDEAIGWLRQTEPTYFGFQGGAVLAYALARAGQVAEARVLAAQFAARARRGEASASDLALIHLGLGDTTRALDWLARVPGEPGTRFFVVDPLWDPLRASPRFTQVVAALRVEAP